MNPFRLLYLKLTSSSETYASIRQDSLDKALLKKQKRAMRHELPLAAATSLLEDLPRQLDSLSTQRVMRDCETSDLTLALAGAGGKVLLHFLEQCADRGQIILLEDVLCRKSESIQSIVAAQQRVLENAQQVLSRPHGV